LVSSASKLFGALARCGKGQRCPLSQKTYTIAPDNDKP